MLLVRCVWLRVILALSWSFLCIAAMEALLGCFAENLLLMKYGVTEFLKEEFVGHDLADAMTQDWKLAKLIDRRP